MSMNAIDKMTKGCCAHIVFDTKNVDCQPQILSFYRKQKLAVAIASTADDVALRSIKMPEKGRVR